METRAVEKYIRISPKKARLVADLVRGTNAKEALNILRFTNKKAAKIISKSVKSAISNAEHNNNVEVDTLIIKSISIDGGPSLKRYKAGYKGSPDSILKRTSHITVIVSDEGITKNNKKQIKLVKKDKQDQLKEKVAKTVKAEKVQSDDKSQSKEKK